MRFFVFVLVVIANFSDNGKASVDNVFSIRNNVLLEDSTRNTDKSCYRPCKIKVKPRRCEFKFKIEPVIDEDGKAGLAINNMIPGPHINVCVNDIIVVEVENRIPDQDIAIHWHGVDQRGTPFMDGVPMITQCPIGYGLKYKYAFRASAPGTFFYHADSVSHQSDGIFGTLVVNQPQPLETHSALYDYDRSEENTLIISAAFPQVLTGNLEDLNQVKPISLNVNGKGEISKVFVMENFAYRLRLINAIGIDCPVVFNIDDHDITVIASDGKPVKPVTARNVLLYPGERMDIVLRATQEPVGYWSHIQGYGGACIGLHARSMIIYSGFNYTSMLSEEKKELTSFDNDQTSIVYGQILNSISDVSLSSSEVKSIYLGIDRKTANTNVVNDFRYVSDAMPQTSFFPAPLSLRQDGVIQINGKSFLYPNAPLLLSPNDVKPEIVCDVGEERKHSDPQCLQVLTAKENEIIELLLVNEGFGSNDTFTFHLHGYYMQVVATWQNPKKIPVSKDEFLKWDHEGKVERNLINPALKDTVVVPNKGYTIVRIRPDNPGSWMLECRACGLYSLPTALSIHVPQKLPKSILDSLPKCGNYKPPDVLLN